MKRKLFSILAVIPAALALVACDGGKDKTDGSGESSITTKGAKESTTKGSDDEQGTSPIDEEKLTAALKNLEEGDYLVSFETKIVTVNNGERDEDIAVTTVGKKGDIIWSLSAGSNSAFVIDGDNVHIYSKRDEGDWYFEGTETRDSIAMALTYNDTFLNQTLGRNLLFDLDDAKKTGSTTVAGVPCDIYEVVYGAATYYGSYGDKCIYKINSDGFCFSYHIGVEATTIEETVSSYSETNVIEFTTNPTAPELPEPQQDR